MHLQQVLNNLVSNAIKFTTEGKVELRCEHTGTIDGRERILFTVEDTGIGISPENQSKIFQSFQQEDESVTRRFGGTGLGLAISRQLVELMGGELLVESAKNQGSRFYFIIEFEPGQVESTLSPETPEPEKPMSLEGIRVLLVEDNKFNQFIAQALLEKWKAVPVICDDGQQAVDILRTKSFDLILMDLQMPVMDGLTASGLIRQELKLKTPILALTANVVVGVVERCEQAGMQGYVSKPFDEVDLFNKIIAVLKSSVAEPEPPSPEQVPDLSDISRLIKMVGNDRTLLSKMISKFLDVTPEYAGDLHKAAAAKDTDAIARISHKIKSAIDLVSADIMRDLILEINDLSKNGHQGEDLYEKIGKFQRFFALLTEQLRSRIEGEQQS